MGPHIQQKELPYVIWRSLFGLSRRKAEQGIFDVVVLIFPVGGEMWIFILMALTLPRGLP